MKLCEARAAEGGLPDSDQSLGQGNAFQVQKAVKGMISHGGDSLADGHAADAGAEGVPGGLVPEVLPAQAVFLTAQGSRGNFANAGQPKLPLPRDAPGKARGRPGGGGVFRRSGRRRQRE